MSYSRTFDKGTQFETKHYYKDKECKILHREDGPAIEWYGGVKSYYLNNIYYNETIYWKEVARIRFGDFI